MPNLWTKKLTKQGYNSLDSTIQEMSDFFETLVENLEAPAPAVKKPLRKRTTRAISFNDAEEDSSDDEK